MRLRGDSPRGTRPRSPGRSRTPAVCPDASTEIEPTDAPPVDLDPPTPLPEEVIRWRELADRDYYVFHDGDASNVIPFPRPVWADPDCDIVGPAIFDCYYTSNWVDVPVSNTRGRNDDETLVPASVRVRAKLCGDGALYVGMSDRRMGEGKWTFGFGVGLTLAEATDLAHVLLAAVDLLGGPK